VLVSASVVLASEEPTAAVASAPTAIRAAAASKPKPTPPLTATGILRFGDSYPKAAGYERFSYVLVTRQFAGEAARLPGKSLVYMNGTTVQTGWSTGVTYQETLANDWILRDAGGALMTNGQYGGYVADIGSRGYQERFVANVAAFLTRNKNDGVFLDDVLAGGGGLHGSLPAKYPTDQAWEDAMVSFIAHVGPALKAKGLYVLANAAAWLPSDPTTLTGEGYARFYKRIAPFLNGLMTEFWMQTPADVAQLRSLGSHWSEHWDGWQSLVSSTQGAGADFFALTYGDDTDRRAMRYGRASFLLDWNGRGGAFIWNPVDNHDPYAPTAVKQLGRPVTPKLQRADGVWQRRYEKGMVLVNPTKSDVTVRVGQSNITIAPADAIFARLPKP
jgi:hypothetical protein